MPKRQNPLLAALGWICVVALVVCSVFAVRECSGQNARSQGTTETGSQQQEQESSSKSKKATVEVMMVGDVLMHDELVESGYTSDGSFDFGFIFQNIEDYIDAADVRILNQETVMGDPSLGYSLYMGDSGPIMNTPTALADTEADLGFNVILKATNHTLDHGYDGLAHELEYWKEYHPGTPVLGVSNPYAEEDDDSQNYVDNVYVGDFNGIKVAVLNYTYATNENVDWDTDEAYISYLSKDKIRSDVKKARAAGAEMIIACPHWGIEYNTEPSEEETTYAKLFCDLGVDVILGSHPHVLQPIELMENDEGHKTVCFYSLSDFVAASGMQTNALIGGVARVTLQRDKKGNCSVVAASLVPTVICNTIGPNMSAFPITEWTEELAEESAQPSLTPDYAYSFVSDLYGNQFDESTGVVTLDLDGVTKSA